MYCIFTKKLRVILSTKSKIFTVLSEGWATDRQTNLCTAAGWWYCHKYSSKSAGIWWRRRARGKRESRPKATTREEARWESQICFRKQRRWIGKQQQRKQRETLKGNFEITSRPRFFTFHVRIERRRKLSIYLVYGSSLRSWWFRARYQFWIGLFQFEKDCTI